MQPISLTKLKKIYSLIDLTDLNESINITALCKKAIYFDTNVAAICIYPQFISSIVKALPSSRIKIATVVNFPTGEESLEQVTADIEQALKQGAQEIDVVFPYKRYLAGNISFAENFVRECKHICGNQLLKIILETGAFSDANTIKTASRLCIQAGADFLKTSTGKISAGATLEATSILLSCMKEHKASHIGLKVSGGIKTIAQAEEYITLAEKIMGADWVTLHHFRIGASQLVDQLNDSYCRI